MTIAEYALARVAAQLLEQAESRDLTNREVGVLDTVLIPAIDRYEQREMRASKAHAGAGGTVESSPTLPAQPAQRLRGPGVL